MADPRLARLGELIVGYSLGLQAGKVFRIDTPYVGVPLAIELYRAGLRAGALPYANVELEELPEILVRDGSEEQLDFVPPPRSARSTRSTRSRRSGRRGTPAR